jgi:NAD(P)-dependent dehydrogenase (short-subunit alcohol dehydrogenase family)
MIMGGNVLITGTSSGLGYALASIFLMKGYNVYGLSRGVSDLEITQEKCDLSNLDTIKEHLSNLVGDIELDYVFLNAGMLGNIDTLSNVTIDQFNEIFNVNVLSNKIILDHLMENNKPKTVIGLSSGAALKTYYGWSLYCTSKSAFKQLISAYSDEYRDTFFLNLAPGLIKSKMQYNIKSLDVGKFPSLQKFHDAYDDMDTPEVVAYKIVDNLNIFTNTESGGYLDMRNI